MLWKDINFIMKNYYKYIVIVIIFLVILSKFNSSSTSNMNDSVKIYTLVNDTIVNNVVESNKEFFVVEKIENLEQGYKKINENKDVDAIVFWNKDKESIDIYQNTNKGNDIKVVLNQMINKLDYELKYIGNNSEDEKLRLENLITKFSFIAIFVCLIIPYKMIVDERKYMKAIVFSPIKNYSIILSKVICTILLYSIILLYFYFAENLSIKELILFSLNGLLFIPIGTIMGVMSESKIASIISLIIMFMCPVIMSNIINNNMDGILYLLNDNYMFLMVGILAVIIFIAINIIATYIFNIKLRRDRVCGNP